MEWIFFIGIVLCLIDIESKLNKIINNKKKSTYNLENYINKKVSINIDNDDVTDSYMFSTISDSTGQIIEYDDEWLLFRYHNKSKRKTVNQYIRINDITSINEIK